MRARMVTVVNMSCCLATSESEAWFGLILREQYPFFVVCGLHGVAAVVNEGLFTSHSMQSFVLLAIIWGLYSFLGRIKSPVLRKVTFFLYYQAIQTMQLLFALQYPAINFLYIISSTIVLIHLEIAMYLDVVTSSILIGKFFLMWAVYALQYANLSGYFMEIVLTMAWSVFHLLSCTATRREILHKRQSYIRLIKEEQERTQALLQSIPDGTIVITEQGQVVTHNRMLIRMLQLDNEKIDEQLYATLRSLMYATSYKKTTTKHQNLLDDVLEHIRTVKQNTSVDFGSVLYLGHYLEWRGTTSVWNQTKACILVVREVGEWVQLEALAKKESEAKSALIRSVSHELRTPINAIINISQQLLEHSSLSPTDIEHCQILVSSSSILLNNVNDLLDFSRIASKQFTINKSQFLLKEAVKSCVEMIEPQCRLKKLDLCLRYDPTIPPEIHNDANRLKQVVLNLLSNALKFTIKGKIEITVTLTSANGVKIEVQDTGIGIEMQDVKRIFGLFGKLAGNERINPQGCGLGLAISNTLVQNMGGRGITVKSKPGFGSVFSFTIPISESECDCLEEDVERINTEEGEAVMVVLPPEQELWRDPRTKANTLIADDSDFNRLVLREMLESMGFFCEEASTGAQALSRIEQREVEQCPYKMIFLDIEMPEMSGIEVAEELRRRVTAGNLSKARVVGCSAYVSEEDRTACLQAGMDDFLEKPVFKEALAAICRLVTL